MQNEQRYAVVESTQFRRDRKRLKKAGRYNFEKLKLIVRMLAAGDSLPEYCRDHPLKGDLAGNRECHIEGDWLLIYVRKEDVLILQLLRTGTHSDLFGE